MPGSWVARVSAVTRDICEGRVHSGSCHCVVLHTSLPCWPRAWDFLSQSVHVLEGAAPVRSHQVIAVSLVQGLPVVMWPRGGSCSWRPVTVALRSSWVTVVCVGTT